jgi:hypothetical protein
LLNFARSSGQDGGAVMTDPANASAGLSGNREHHIGRLSLSNAMMRRSNTDLEENHEPDQRYKQSQLDNRD